MARTLDVVGAQVSARALSFPDRANGFVEDFANLAMLVDEGGKAHSREIAGDPSLSGAFRGKWAGYDALRCPKAT